MSSAAERAKIKQFNDCTGETDRIAKQYLQRFKWNLEQAVDAYFSEGNAPAGGAAVDRNKIKEAFDQFKDESGTVSGENLEKFAQAIGVNADDIILFAFAWKCNAKQLGEFTETEFVEGFTKLRVDSIQKLRDQVPTLREDLKKDAVFKEFYSFMFDYIKERDQKSLGFEVAYELWPMLLKDKFAYLDQWLAFLKQNYSHRSIARDTWMQLLEFTKVTDLNDYNFSGAWPVVIDEFVDHMGFGSLRNSNG
eukprot:TRINITY_DN7058_c0_g1_i1.p1 TRINITY_DN7058_c0_g1~~TRINITY_DN7058_c0_g1_i1.p1  ORF type:complete len:250 (+),score=59.85 TRINITY_DN7058_c0_g1_i1:168-917(+)